MILKLCSRSGWSKYAPMKIKQSKFFCGQKVMVIEGTKDPDYDSDIGGWTGGIEEIFLSEENDET